MQGKLNVMDKLKVMYVLCIASLKVTGVLCMES